MTADGRVLTTANGPFKVSQVHKITNDTYTGDLTADSLRTEDNGSYICEAGVVGNYTTGLFAREPFDIVVQRKWQMHAAMVMSWSVKSLVGGWQYHVTVLVGQTSYRNFTNTKAIWNFNLYWF